MAKMALQMKVRAHSDLYRCHALLDELTSHRRVIAAPIGRALDVVPRNSSMILTKRLFGRSH
jgi:hypothetical protein